ncbi:MAG: hypothetical protein GY842_14240 [bacterium]|nr:hypothetical protein [bacterium]
MWLSCGAVVFLVLAALWLEFSGERWTTGTIEESKRIGNGIARALEAYYEDTGIFPASLDQLVPTYIDEIRPPTAGMPVWDYTSSEDYFGLSFGCGKDRYPCCDLNRTASGAHWILDH